jgi:hypothetical protein
MQMPVHGDLESCKITLEFLAKEEFSEPKRSRKRARRQDGLVDSEGGVDSTRDIADYGGNVDSPGEGDDQGFWQV